jgi:lipopolysaccharide transport system ATP-binding protein
MSNIVIRADGLGKKYVIDHQVERVPYTALRDVISEAASSFLTSVLKLSRPRLSLKTKEEFWALRDLTFEIQRGDVVGVVGRNGAGKSTLLRILSRITEPTEGRVTIAGRVASLLEVGTGFHPELTGRENIYLNGAILGMSRAEVRSKFDEIVHFADVERFLDTPVKRFSSGMYMRLAFAVAAFLESDILIVDEVLAVGDAAFQRKCLGRMGDVSASGRTVLFVSHNIGSLLSICHKGILLEAGRLAATSDMRSIAQAYQKLGEAGGTVLGRQSFSGPLTSIEFERLELNGKPLIGQMFVSPSEQLVFTVTGKSILDIPNFRFSFALFREGVRLFTVHDGPDLLREGVFSATITIPARLLRPGDYQVGLGGRRVDGDDWIWGRDLATATVVDEWQEGYDRDDIGLINLQNTIKRVDHPFRGRTEAPEITRQTA